jgi:hypothetical protein
VNWWGEAGADAAHEAKAGAAANSTFVIAAEAARIPADTSLRMRLAPPGAVGLPVAGVVSDGPGTVLRVRVEVAISRTHSRSTAIRLAGAGRHQ